MFYVTKKVFLVPKVPLSFEYIFTFECVQLEVKMHGFRLVEEVGIINIKGGPSVPTLTSRLSSPVKIYTVVCNHDSSSFKINCQKSLANYPQ